MLMTPRQIYTRHASAILKEDPPTYCHTHQPCIGDILNDCPSGLKSRVHHNLSPTMCNILVSPRPPPPPMFGSLVRFGLGDIGSGDFSMSHISDFSMSHHACALRRAAGLISVPVSCNVGRLHKAWCRWSRPCYSAAADGIIFALFSQRNTEQLCHLPQIPVLVT